MSFFIAGEQKIRPGTYIRYWNRGSRPIAGVDDGVCAAVFRSNWGPVDEPTIIENFEDIARLYGEGGTNGRTAVPFEQFRGGARRVVAMRLGMGGTRGSYGIMDASNTEAMRLVLLHPGSKEFMLTIRPTLEDPDQSEMLLTDGTMLLERYAFSTGDGANQAANLLAALRAVQSNYFSWAEITASNEPLAIIDQARFTQGTDPTITVAAYSRAFEKLEAERWNVLSIDANDDAVHAMTQMFLNRVYQNGKFVMGVIGEPATGPDAVPFATRLIHASAYNDYQIVYVGNGWADITGTAHEGWLAAARVAGEIAGTPSNEATTRLAVRNAVGLTEKLRNWQIERALTSGMFVFSRSSANTVWIEQGINTLVLPRSNQDIGWKKIKRVKVRFELFDRLIRTVDPLIGRLNNDDDGRMTIVQLGNGVCNAMVSEQKLLPGAHVELDPDNPPQGDSAWFRVFADDIDALEKIYHAFGFRFAPDEA